MIDGNGLQAQAATVRVRALPAQAGTAGPQDCRLFAAGSPKTPPPSRQSSASAVLKECRTSFPPKSAPTLVVKIRNDVRTLEGVTTLVGPPPTAVPESGN